VKEMFEGIKAHCYIEQMFIRALRRYPLLWHLGLVWEYEGWVVPLILGERENTLYTFAPMSFREGGSAMTSVSDWSVCRKMVTQANGRIAMTQVQLPS
jgi:hypothetical protein